MASAFSVGLGLPRRKDAEVEIAKVCPKCECPMWSQTSFRTADAHSAWKDDDGTWYNGPASERTERRCTHCGWTQRITKERGKTVSIENDET